MSTYPETVTKSGFATTIGFPPSAAHWTMSSWSASVDCRSTSPSGVPSPSVPCTSMKSHSPGDMTGLSPSEEMSTAPLLPHVKCRHFLPRFSHSIDGRFSKNWWVTSPLVSPPERGFRLLSFQAVQCWLACLSFSFLLHTR
jgi:hypothetical protein